MRVARPVPLAGAAFAVLHQTREFILNVHAYPCLFLFADGISTSREEIRVCTRSRNKRQNSTSIFIEKRLALLLNHPFQLKFSPDSRRLKSHAFPSLLILTAIFHRSDTSHTF